MDTTLDKEFTAILRKSPAKGGWTYLVMPERGTQPTAGP
jgi:hypothetical protein